MHLIEFFERLLSIRTKKIHGRFHNKYKENTEWKDAWEKEIDEEKGSRDTRSMATIKKAVVTRTSQAVPHLSTNHALSRLTSEFGWDPVYSA